MISFATRCVRSRPAGLCATARRSFAAAADAVVPWRQMGNATAAQREAWAAEDVLLHAQMREHVPEALAHNGEEAFDDHLVGVQSVLRTWGAKETLCNAALFHSIYGTEGFQGYKLPLSHRSEIAALIGEDAERLAWIFCMVDRPTVDQTVMNPPRPSDPPPSFRSRLELGDFEIRLRSYDEWFDFVTLSLADWLEQVEGAARKANPAVRWGKGEAWAYRRDSYKAMAQILEQGGLKVAAQMYEEVFARGGAHTRHLVQNYLPPISDAGREAREAIASFGLPAEGRLACLDDQLWAPAPRERASC